MIISDLSHLETIETNEIQGGRRFVLAPTITTNVGIIVNPQIAVSLSGRRGLSLAANFSNNSIDQRA